MSSEYWDFGNNDDSLKSVLYLLQHCVTGSRMNYMIQVPR
uniref:Uncharacterized protein n=1 Tax=Rhizophora mucronata TaxID=61149 RepID=A0A2P2J277_RHIMU